jgi:tetratricopeptide (TPR) repeat protein
MLKVILILELFLAGCSSTYQIRSMPDGALVSYTEPSTNRQLYLGTTPLTYSKSALATDRAMVLTIKKEGFLPEMIPLVPTNESNTLINVNLKPDDKSPTKATSEWNAIIARLFEAQRMIYQRQFHAALLELDKIVKDKPDLVQAHIMKGTSYYLLNEMNSAINAWKTALRLDPNNAELLQVLNQMKISVKSLEEKP